MEKNICGMPGDADRHVAHQLHTMMVRMFAECSPLAVAQPLHECEVAEPVIDCRTILFSAIRDESARTLRGAEVCWPMIPNARNLLLG